MFLLYTNKLFNLFLGSNYYVVNKDVNTIMQEIFINGPVTTSMVLFKDILVYDSGIYQHVSQNFIGYQSVKIIGWGIENNVPYWLCVNSWNIDWGINGLFKIIQGLDECDIESSVVTGIANVI